MILIKHHVGGYSIFRQTHMETAMGSEVILPKTPQIHHSKGRGMSRLSGRQQVQICASVICGHLQSTTVLQAIPSAIPSPKNTCAGRGCCRGWKLLEVSCSTRRAWARSTDTSCDTVILCDTRSRDPVTVNAC